MLVVRYIMVNQEATPAWREAVIYLSTWWFYMLITTHMSRQYKRMYRRVIVRVLDTIFV